MRSEPLCRQAGSTTYDNLEQPLLFPTAILVVNWFQKYYQHSVLKAITWDFTNLHLQEETKSFMNKQPIKTGDPKNSWGRWKLAVHGSSDWFSSHWKRWRPLRRAGQWLEQRQEAAPTQRPQTHAVYELQRHSNISGLNSFSKVSFRTSPDIFTSWLTTSTHLHIKVIFSAKISIYNDKW